MRLGGRLERADAVGSRLRAGRRFGQRESLEQKGIDCHQQT